MNFIGVSLPPNFRKVFFFFLGMCGLSGGCEFFLSGLRLDLGVEEITPLFCKMTPLWLNVGGFASLFFHRVPFCHRLQPLK